MRLAKTHKNRIRSLNSNELNARHTHAIANAHTASDWLLPVFYVSKRQIQCYFCLIQDTRFSYTARSKYGNYMRIHEKIKKQIIYQVMNKIKKLISKSLFTKNTWMTDIHFKCLAYNSLLLSYAIGQFSAVRLNVKLCNLLLHHNKQTHTPEYSYLAYVVRAHEWNFHVTNINNLAFEKWAPIFSLLRLNRAILFNAQLCYSCENYRNRGIEECSP